MSVDKDKDNDNKILAWLDANSEKFAGISDQIWEFAEPRFEEVKSAKILIKTLEDEGFSVQKGVADMPTAFIGSFGTNGPVIAILGEYDALSNLSQVSNALEKKTLEEGKAGHGCSHNLLGVGSLAASLAVKKYLQENKIPGTIRYYGCPAEEGGSGKTYMVRAGLFTDVDIALCWHPFAFNSMFSVPTLANIQAYFKFTGRAAHAAVEPENGRSALDAVELMNVGVNYMREHIISDARVHYAVTNTGGSAPNVVQANAEVLYLIRAPNILQVNEIYERIINVAKGAAMMTGTKVDVIFDKAASNFIPNDTIGDALHKNLRKVGSPHFTEEEISYGKQLQSTFVTSSGEVFALAGLMKKMGVDLGKELRGKTLLDITFPYIKTEVVMPGSTDVGDVSWVVPTNQIGTSCMVLGTSGHSWQQVTQGKTSFAHKGMIFAGKVMALTAKEILLNPDLVELAKEELQKKLENNPYVCPIPPEVKPNVPDWVKAAMD